MADDNHKSKDADPTAHCIWRFANAEYNTARMELVVNGAVARLPGNPRKLLEVFLDNQNQIMSHDYLVSQIWPNDSGKDKSNLTGLINALRDVLGEDAGKHIDTHPGIGYEFLDAKKLPLPGQEDTVSDLAHHGEPGSPPTVAANLASSTPLFTHRRWVLSGVAVCVALAALLFWGLNAPSLPQEFTTDSVPEESQAFSTGITQTGATSHSPGESPPSLNKDWLAHARGDAPISTPAQQRGEKLFQEGLTQYLLDNTQAAMGKFTTARVFNRDAGGYTAGLAAAYAADGRFEQAEKFVKELSGPNGATDKRTRIAAKIHVLYHRRDETNPSALLADFENLAAQAAQIEDAKSPEYWAARFGEGLAQSELKQWQKAADTLTEAYNHLAEFGDHTYWYAARVAAPLGRAYREMGQCSEALAILEKAEAAQKALLTDSHPDILRTQLHWAACLLATRQTERAAPIVQGLSDNNNLNVLPPKLAADIKELVAAINRPKVFTADERE